MQEAHNHEKQGTTHSPKNCAPLGQVKRLVRLALVHYGNDEFVYEKFANPTGESRIGIKPKCGLWASPVSSKYGWREWCEDNDFGDLSKSFCFQFHGSLLIINSVEDLENLPWIEDSILPKIDFTEIVKRYDGMMVTEKGERETRFTFPKSLYGWDCESVVIFNRDCIEA